MRFLSLGAVRLIVAGVVLIGLALGLALAVADLEQSADESRAGASAERLRAGFFALSADQESDLRYLLGVARGAPALVDDEIRGPVPDDDPRGVSVWTVSAGALTRIASGGAPQSRAAARRAAGRVRPGRGLTLSAVPGRSDRILYAIKERSGAGSIAAVMEVPLPDASISPPIEGASGIGQIWLGAPDAGALVYSSAGSDSTPSARSERPLELGDSTLTVVVRDDIGPPVLAILLGVMAVVLMLGLVGAAVAVRRRARQNARLLSENASLNGRIKLSEDRREQSERDAERDALTGLLNRAVITRHLSRSVARAKRTKEVSALFFIDLDGFKEINDTLGHQAGDELLVSISQRLTQAFRGNDTVARFAGDEFCVLCENVLDGGAAACLKIERLLAEPVYFGGKTLPVRASIGMALSGEISDDPDAVLRAADAAMYRAKQKGGGRVEVATADVVPTEAGDPT